MTTKFILPEIAAALTGFVNAEKVGEVLSLAVASDKLTPVIMHGRGGHGKSEITRAVFKAREQLLGHKYGIQSFGEGMTEARMYGGINMKALNCNENPRQEFQVEGSFLNYENYLFEELFDAPPVVLLSLKDTLTSRCLNNGSQKYEMKTLMLIAATNKNPAEITEMGSSYEALVERFPLQICVEWESYRQEDFYKLFTTADTNSSKVVVSNELKKTLAGLIADAHCKGEWISPRQAMVCLSAVRAAATIRGRKEAKEEDLWSIMYIPGTGGILTDLQENLERVRVVREASEQLKKAKKDVEEIRQRMGDTERNQKIPSSQKSSMFLKFRVQLQAIEKKIADIRVPDSLTEERYTLKKSGFELSNIALECAERNAG